MLKKLKAAGYQSVAHVAGFELSCWFFLLSWAVSTLGVVAKLQMDPILI